MKARSSVASTALAGLLCVVALAGAPGSAVAAQPPPSNPSDEELEDERDGVQSAAGRVGVLANRVATAGAELSSAQLELADTYDDVTEARERQRAARVVADAAQAVAGDARADLEAGTDRIRETQRKVDEFAAASYRQGNTVGSTAAFLGSDSPQDLLARAELLESVGGSQLDGLDVLRRARVEMANLDSKARAALDEARAKEQAAEQSKAAADTAYAAAVDAEAAQQQRTEQLLTRQSDLENQLAEARGGLTELEGKRERFEDWQAAEQAAAEEAAQEPAQPSQDEQPATGASDAGGASSQSGSTVLPATGQITSTYGPRWGSIHYGLDIANSIGTPIVTPLDGEIISAGPASGFGLWVRVRHDSGTVTVYGHINEALVSVGERVDAGEQIATIGNRGESTGPHLHLEVHQDGSKIDPLVWLRSKGVSI